MIPTGDIELVRGSTFTLELQLNSTLLQEYLLVDLTTGTPIYRNLKRFYEAGVVNFRIDPEAAGVIPFNLTGSELIFIAQWLAADGSTGTLRKSTADLGSGFTLLVVSNKAKLVLTPAETRAFPRGRIATFEIERRISGTEEVLGTGFINAKGGLNDDA